MYNERHIRFFCEIFKHTRSHMIRIIREKKLNTYKLYDYFMKKELDRDKFYSMFESEDLADDWWTVYVDEYLYGGE